MCCADDQVSQMRKANPLAAIEKGEMAKQYKLQ
jgi:hypothetical protein